MSVGFDWDILRNIGAGGLGIVSLFVFYKIFHLFIDQWSKSTDAINRNTDTHNEMRDMLHKSHIRDLEFQKEVINIVRDTNEKVTHIKDKLD